MRINSNSNTKIMDCEIVNRIEVLKTGELLLGLKGLGRPMYQYVYRAASGVYWDESKHGFKSTPIREWTCSKWYKHIVSVVRGELGVEILLAEHVLWSGVPENDRVEILRDDAI